MSEVNTISFIYKNAAKEVKPVTLKPLKRFENHFSGVDTDSGRYKIYRKDRVIDYLEEAHNILQTLPLEVFKQPKGGTKSFGVNSYNPKNLLEVCFTGFRKADKERLTALAKENNLYVAKDTTINLAFLVCGYNAGPKKMERAANSAQKVEIMEEEEFLHFLKTGEVKGTF